MSAPKVFADFHNADSRGRVRLNCKGTLDDLKRQDLDLTPGMVLTLYSEGLETTGTVEFSAEEGMWVALVDWSTLQ